MTQVSAGTWPGMDEGPAATTDPARKRDLTSCPRCGKTMLPRLTATARPVVDGAPLCAESPVRLACLSCS